MAPAEGHDRAGSLALVTGQWPSDAKAVAAVKAARELGHALGWDVGEGAMNLRDDLFAWFTLARRPAPGAPK